MNMCENQTEFNALIPDLDLPDGEPILDDDFIQFILDDNCSTRFGDYTSDEIASMNASTVPKNTINRNKWADNLFQKLTDAKYLEIVDLSSLGPEGLNIQVSKFIHEVRKANGQRYPGQTLISVIAGLQGFISCTHRVNFFRDNTFLPIKTSLDASMKLSAAGGKSLVLNKQKSFR